jgi:hypothetical protein
MAKAPTDPSVGAIDALRGLALFGVLAIWKPSFVSRSSGGKTCGFSSPDSRHRGLALPLRNAMRAIPSPRALQGAGRRAGHGRAAIARLARVDALIHVFRIVGAVVPHGTGGGRAGDILLRLAGRHGESKDNDRKSPHGIAL